MRLVQFYMYIEIHSHIGIHLIFAVSATDAIFMIFFPTEKINFRFAAKKKVTILFKIT